MAPPIGVALRVESGGLMKLATDLVNAVLIKNGIVPTSINVAGKAIDTSASQPVSENNAFISVRP